MTYKHFIITRLMCDNFIKDKTEVDVQSDDWMEMSINMCKKHIIPTLENQTDKMFELVFLVGNDIDYDYCFELFGLSTDIPINVVKLSEFKDFIENVNTDYLITSRLDYDDHVYNKCVEDIHKVFNEKQTDILLYGLAQGVSIVDGEKDAYLMYNYPWLFDEGFPAPMATLILKRSAVKEYFDIYKLGYHTDLIKNLNLAQYYYCNNPKYDKNKLYYKHKGYDVDYIWIRHKHSASAIVENVIHTTNIKVNLRKKQLKDIFGYEYERS